MTCIASISELATEITVFIRYQRRKICSCVVRPDVVNFVFSLSFRFMMVTQVADEHSLGLFATFPKVTLV
jgi:hypothetical protein